MTLSVSYRELIIEQIMLEYLYNGVIPTVDQIEEDLKTYQEVHLDLSLPKSKYIDFSVTRGSNSSAGTIKSFKDAVSNDFMALTKEIYNLATKNNTYYSRWISEIEYLKTTASKLEDKADSLLLLSNNTEGYFSTVEDVFADMSLVDTDNTTAKVDVEEHKVILNSGSRLGSITQINTNDLTQADISFYPLNRSVSTSYYNTSTYNTLVNMLRTENSSWVGKIISSRPGSMTAELKIRLSRQELIEISRIQMSSTSPNSSNNSTVTLQYSKDGYNWFLAPTTQATKSFKGVVSWNFSPVELAWVKFIIHKPASDSGRYEYLYSINSIKFYKNSFNEESGTSFYSSALSAVDASDNTIGFFKAQLNVCDNIPDNTSITYALSASKDSLTWTDWHYIIPFNNETNNTVYPKVVNFSGIYDYNNSSSDVLNSNLEPEQITISTDDSDVEYKFPSSNIGCINTKIVIPTNIEADLVANTIEVWRNIRIHNPYPDSLLVREISRGWNLSGQTYSCFFEIVSSSGKTINFGDRACIIDGQEIKGKITIPQGIHKFETLSENWYDFSSSLVDILSKEEYLESIDPLYPYNHKCLIEGIPYPTLFEGEKIYLGADLSASNYCTRTSLFDLTNNENKYNSFAVKNIGLSNNILGIFVKFDNQNIDYINENFYLRWKMADGQTSSYKYIKLKAELSSSNTSVSPELTGYRIKLGT